MSNDLVARASQTAGNVRPAQLGAPAKGADLLARARLAVSAPPQQVFIATPPETDAIVASAPPRQSATPGKLVVAMDAKMGRAYLVELLPDRCEIALAVCSGGETSNNTAWSIDHEQQRRMTSIDCDGRKEHLAELLARVAGIRIDAAAAIDIACDMLSLDSERGLLSFENRAFILTRGHGIERDITGTCHDVFVDMFPSVFQPWKHRLVTFIPDPVGLRRLFRCLNGPIARDYRDVL
jgi:hypothetical protein